MFLVATFYFLFFGFVGSGSKSFDKLIRKRIWIQLNFSYGSESRKIIQIRFATLQALFMFV